jgi:hypothetical protein
MEITLAALADYASTTNQGKLVIGGVFDTITTRKLPARHPMMALALRIQAQPHEPRAHGVSVRFVDPDGEQVLPELKARLQFPNAPESERATAQLVLNMPGVTFKGPGRHAIDLFIDGRQFASVPLWVRLAPDAEATDAEAADPETTDAADSTEPDTTEPGSD